MAVFQRGRFDIYVWDKSLRVNAIGIKNHAFNKRVMILYYVSQYKASGK